VLDLAVDEALHPTAGFFLASIQLADRGGDLRARFAQGSAEVR
jgi:hypothetical protein